MTSPVRVAVVDDSDALRRVVCAYLDSSEDLEVVAQHGSAADALAAVSQACPDVLVLDDQMPGGDGIDALPELRAACPVTRIVVLSAGGPEVADLALERGADAFVGKDGPLDELVEAVRGSTSPRTRERPPTGGRGPQQGVAGEGFEPS